MLFDGTLSEIGSRADCHVNIVDAIFHQFKDRGFIDYTPTKQKIFIRVKVKAHDYIRRGGYVGEEQTMDLEFTKLKKEIESLKVEIPKGKFETITNLLSIIGTVFKGF